MSNKQNDVIYDNMMELGLARKAILRLRFLLESSDSRRKLELGIQEFIQDLEKSLDKAD